METNKKTLQVRKVLLDSELEAGIFEEGRYYIMTPRFDYLGDLEVVTATNYVFTNVSVVFNSGPYDELRAGRPADAQKVGDRAIFDRAGSVLVKMP